ncbi:MAG: hypothetical protein Greene041619_1008 [Candidatus Peregrinibacteria bacterium Greene0416_19]|nr:MAG: hypothetical protein Greene041619_1008 [Candidatus Peregrinibacteria bacterium Greene0416_19]
MRFRALLRILTGGFLAALITWLLLFKVSDSDTWWHIAAGRLLLRDGWIATDPFAYAREGLPYLALHEWLAQRVIASVFLLGGATGLIGLRILFALLTFAVIMAIDWRRLWPNALLVGCAVVVMRQGFIERPQLFSNVFFALSLALCLRLLDEETVRSKTCRRIFLVLSISTVLWANMHGAAALMAPILLGTAFVQRSFDAWRIGRRGDRAARMECLILLGWCVLLVILMLLTPSLLGNVTYLRSLLTDRTAELINEWNPRPLSQYLLWIGPFWAAAIVALAWSRHRVVAVGLLIIGTGLLSRSAQRHEIFFVLTALGCIVYELRWNDRWRALVDRASRHPLLSIVATTVIAALILWINAPYHAFMLRRNLQGVGSFAMSQGAADFLDREKIDGKLFNNYAAGGYLLFRGRKVFLDGRNVDYGYHYLSRALAARYDPAVFYELERTYGFTVATVEYRLGPEGDERAFAFLKNDPTWALIYVDDWATVYLKRIPTHADAIKRSEYRIVTRDIIGNRTLPDALTPDELTRFAAELAHAAQEDPRGIGALLVLSKLLRSQGRFNEAAAIARDAADRMPYRHEPYELLASIAAVQGKWTEAAALYDRMLIVSKGLPLTLPYALLAEVYERAGESRKAARFRRDR